MFLGSILTMFFCANMAFAQATSASAVAAPAPVSSVATASTFAGVADKTVSETFSIIRDSASVVGDTVKKVAPEVWRILILQQYVKAMKNIFVSLMFFLLTYMYYRTINKWYKKPDYDDDAWIVCCRILPAIAAVLVSIIMIFNIDASIQHLINPEYSAILDLVDMAKTMKP